MQSVGNFFSSVADVLHPKKCSFSGAMDVIVIKRPDDTLASTPFYVKFGRFKIMKSNNKIINIIVNGEPSTLKMKLNKTGRAYFCRGPNNLNHEAKTDANIIEKDLSSVLSSETADFEVLDSTSTVKSSRTASRFDLSKEEKKYLSDSEKSSKDSAPDLEQDSRGENLTSEELKSFNLIPGLNVFIFVVEGKSTVALRGRVYLWDFDCKIVVSDIDGTLTKSDILGHLYYYMGKDWTRGGVSNLYCNIVKRGYKIVYLTSRSLSQVESTRTFLSYVDQQGEKLPDGPILLNPSGFFKSIIREISKYSQVFKENAMKQLLRIFPEDVNPFYAGFGNREGDAVAYRNLRIPNKYVFIFKTNKKNDEEYSCITDFNEVSMNFEDVFPEMIELKTWANDEDLINIA